MNGRRRTYTGRSIMKQANTGDYKIDWWGGWDKPNEKDLRKKIYNVIDEHGLWNDRNKDMEYYKTHVIQEVINDLIRTLKIED